MKIYYVVALLLGLEDVYGMCSTRTLLGCADYLGSKAFTKYVYKALIPGDFIFHGTDKTLLLPSEEALDNIPSAVKNAMDTNTTFLRDVLRFHLVASKIDCTKMGDNSLAASKQGMMLRFNKYKEHDETTNETKIIRTVQGAKFLDSPEEPTISGSVCVIDKLLYNIPRMSTYQYVTENRNLTTLLLLASRAGSLDVFKKQNITLLVPENIAFSKLAPGVLQNLSNNPQQIDSILAKHMANSVLFSEGLAFTQKFKSSAGTSYPVNVTGGEVYIGSAKVVESDISTFGGVVHIIDTVLGDPKEILEGVVSWEKSKGILTEEGKDNVDREVKTEEKKERDEIKSMEKRYEKKEEKNKIPQEVEKVGTDEEKEESNFIKSQKKKEKESYDQLYRMISSFDEESKKEEEIKYPEHD